MLVSLPFRRFVRQLAAFLPYRRHSSQRRLQGQVYYAVAAEVQILESRQLLSSIVVNSTSGGQNYAATVTATQLDPAHTAVTLRDAINAANNTQGADTISFDSSVFPTNTSSPTTIVLSGGTPLVLSDTSGATTIVGPGGAQVAISGAGLSTVLVVDNNVTATIDGLTITAGKGSINFGGGQTGAGAIDNNGKLTVQGMVFSSNAGGSFGGGIYNNNVVTIANCTFSGDSAQFGGGLFNGGTATVTGSTFNGNSAGSNGGGFYNLATVTLEASTLAGNGAGGNGGGFYSNNNVVAIDSTITGNSAGSMGGGFINVNNVTLVDCTIAQNFASQGAGVYNLFANTTLSGTIVAQNSASVVNLASRDWGGSSATVSSSYNLIGNGTNTGLVNGTNHNLVGSASSLLNPLLAPLGNYGGPTQTMALLPGSPAVDAGSTTLPIDPISGLPLPYDQRGAGFSRIVGSAADIGAYEQSFIPVTASMAAPSVIYGQDGRVTVSVTPPNATGSLSLFVDGSATAFATHALTAADNGSFTFDLGILNAGAHSLHAVFTGTGVFLSSTADGSLVIARANAAISVAGYSVTYDGNSHTAAGTATEVGGIDLTADLVLVGTSHTNAGTYVDAWTFHDATGNYADASGTVGDSIGKANATFNVTGYTVTYDGNVHTATGTATGAGGADLSNDLSLAGTTHTNAGAYNGDGWTFVDITGNYNNASGTVSDSIARANAAINVVGYNLIYDGNSHTATGTATGAGGVDLSADLSLAATTHTNAGTYADAWSFHDATGNYNDASGIINDSIARATAAISVFAYSGTYDGNAHTATGTAMGVANVDLSAGLNLAGTTHVNAGDYSGDGWTFTDTTGNYNNASGTVIDTLAKANVAINVTGYSVTFDANSHTATGAATGVGGIDLSADLTLTATTHTNAGTYNGDGWTFIDPTGNYNNASGTVDDSIARTNAAINVTGYSVTFDANLHTATGSATGVGGLDLSADLTLAGTTHANAGLYADNWAFHDASGNYNDAAGSVTDSIAQASTSISVNGYGVTYDGHSHTATGTAAGAGGVDLSTDLTLSGTTHTSAGVYTDAWTFHDATGNYSDASGTVTDSIAQASALISANGYVVTFDGHSHTATGTATGAGGVDLSADLKLSGTTHTRAGVYTDIWTFHDATGNYSDASGMVTDSIAQASASISVTGYVATYDGHSHTATGVATGVGGIDLSADLTLSGTTHTSAGVYTDTWTFHDATGNYSDASGKVTDSIFEASASISVTGYVVTYDANLHVATGAAAGAGGVDLSADLTLSGTTHTGAGVYTDTWTFHDATGNYSDASGTVIDSIAQASASISVNGYVVTYDGHAHTATGAAAGAGGVDLSADLTLSGTTHAGAGVYTDKWTFHDATGNYSDASGTVNDSIAQASAVISVTGYVVTYDGHAHTATGAAAGAGGVDLSADLTLSGTTHAGAGVYTDKWTFHDATGNYSDASGTVNDSIAQASAVISVTGYVVTYDGHAHTATGTAAGAGGVDLSADLTLSGTTHTGAGVYADTWTFHDAAGNYTDASGTVSDSIAQASASISVNGYVVAYDGHSHTATGTAQGIGGVDLSADLTLTGTTHTGAGTYADTWTFHDATGNYADASGTVADSIAKANAVITVAGYSGIYDGAAHGASGTMTGVDAGGAATGGNLNLGTTFKNAPGGTAHWTFSGGANYNDAAGDVSIAIGARTVTGSVTAANKVFDGTTTATINGASLGGVITGDDVHLTVGAANFANRNVGTWTVTASGLGLSGAAAGNYVLASNTAVTTASITPSTTTTTPLEAVLKTARVINVTKDGSIEFKFSNVTGIVDGQTVAQLFNGVQFSIKIGSTLISGTATAKVVDGSIYVSWHMNHELRADLYALLNAAATSTKTTVNLTVYATSRDGKYTLSEVVETRVFRPGHEHHHKDTHESHVCDKDKR